MLNVKKIVTLCLTIVIVFGMGFSTVYANEYVKIGDQKFNVSSKSIELDSDYIGYKSLKNIAKLKNLKTLRIASNVEFEDDAPIGNLDNLKKLIVSDNLSPETLEKLTSLRNLETEFLDCDQKYLSAISKLVNLRKLSISVNYSAKDSIGELSTLTHLNTLELSVGDEGFILENDQYGSIESLSSLANLKNLRIEGVSIGTIPDFAKLKSLEIIVANQGTRTAIKAKLPRLKNISICYYKGGESDLSGLSNYKNLKSLEIWNMNTSNLNYLAGIESLTKIRSVNICGGTALIDLNFLNGSCDSIQSLTISGEIADISSISNMHNLKKFFAKSFSNNDIGYLSSLKALKRVELPKGCEDISPLNSLKKIKRVDNVDTDIIKPSILDEFMTKHKKAKLYDTELNRIKY